MRKHTGSVRERPPLLKWVASQVRVSSCCTPPTSSCQLCRNCSTGSVYQLLLVSAKHSAVCSTSCHHLVVVALLLTLAATHLDTRVSIFSMFSWSKQSLTLDDEQWRRAGGFPSTRMNIVDGIVHMCMLMFTCCPAKVHQPQDQWTTMIFVRIKAATMSQIHSNDHWKTKVHHTWVLLFLPWLFAASVLICCQKTTMIVSIVKNLSTMSQFLLFEAACILLISVHKRHTVEK